MRLNRSVFAAAFLAVLSSACHAAPPEDTSALVLRTYEVPKGSARAVVTTLDAVFWMGEQQKRLGRAMVTPDGQLAVVAPANVQIGVQTLVEEVAKHPPTYDQSIELHYFVLVGKPAPSPQPLPAGTSEIKSAMDEIVRSQGPQTFTVASQVHLSSLNGDDGKVASEQLTISQKAAQTNDGVDAIVEIQFAKNDKLDTRVHLGPDRIVVLGAASQHADAAESSTLYYVVRIAPRAADGKSP